MIFQFLIFKIFITKLKLSFSQAFRLGYCQNEGNLIGHLGKIPDEFTCQRACNDIQNCDLYRYDTTSQDCSILSDSSVTDTDCDVIAGPQSPTFGQCTDF